MHNETTPSTISRAAAALLAVAVVAGTALAGTLFAQLALHVTVIQGLPAAFAAVAAVSGCGFLVRNSQDAIGRRFDRLEQRLDERGGFIDEESAAAARRLNLRLLSNPN
ncbi:MAG TPA: hypothetical protein VF174_05700 [Micromonosporaceae bacterium]